MLLSLLAGRRLAPTASADHPGIQGIPLTNPEFELYDNVGRTSEQILAARIGGITWDDLRRWAEGDADAFRSAHPLPDTLPAPDLTPFKNALREAATPVEFSHILNSLVEAVQPVLDEVVDLLELARVWNAHHVNAAPDSPSKLLQRAGSSISLGLSYTARADMELLRAHYIAEDVRAAPPAPPAAQPGPPSNGGRPQRR
ncbi:hypothetical protein [Streptomyces sp. NPDC003435]